MKDLEKTIAENVVFYRKRLGIKQKDFAKMLEIPVSRLSNWENGYNSMDLDSLCRICDMLGVSVEQICGRKSNIQDATLTQQERDLVIAYRLKPEMQTAVQTLLGMCESNFSAPASILCAPSVSAPAQAAQKQDTKKTVVKVPASAIRRVYNAAKSESSATDKG